MELSGLDRLLAYARQLGVERADPSAPNRNAAATPAARRSEESGLRLSLSERATRLAAADTATVERPASDASITGRNGRTGSARHREAFAAYQRSATSIRDERIRVIA